MKEKLKKYKKYLFFTIPIIIFAYFSLINEITILLNSSSDIGVFIGILLFSILLLLTYLLIKILKQKL